MNTSDSSYELRYNKNICLLIVFGLPASGKSTFINWMKKHHVHMTDCTYIVEGICFDDILLSSSLKNNVINSHNIAFEPSLWKSSQNLFKDRIKSLIMNTIEEEASHDKKDGGYHLIYIEDVMHYNSMRQTYINIAKHYKIVYIQLYLKIQLDTCLKNNYDRKGFNKIPDEVIKNLNEKFEMPDENEGNGANLVALESLSEDKMKNAFVDILNQWKSFTFNEQMKIHNNRKSHMNYEHCLDLRLRKCVNESISFLNEKNVETKISYIKSINQLKQTFFKANVSLDNNNKEEIEDIISCFKDQLNELLTSFKVIL